MRTDDLDFDLPPELIATAPPDERDAARMLVASRSDPSAPVRHLLVRDLPEVLSADDLLVLNRTRVIPARFVGVNEQTGGSVEGLWLADAADGLAEPWPLRWRVLLRARRTRPGRTIALLSPDGTPSGVRLELAEKATGPRSESGAEPASEPGSWTVVVHDAAGNRPTSAVLEATGRTPLPPYILNARKAEGGVPVDDATDRARYQTTYAREGASIAAPTAGLHFTPELLQRLEARGVGRAELTLDVGAGTFRPIETDTVDAHPMHMERCSMDPDALGRVFGGDGKRVIAVGSTSVRTIETYAAVLARGEAPPASTETDLLISPGYEWYRVDAIFTNFHLPRSTLIAMIAASVEGGIERVRELYQEAIDHRYRFFSYGDAMLLLP
ncbi:MAG: tRNA preQ1(34) S-adenosylmethionine ribosyltransferase-isomerase QueA [Planctomycetota bacterium]